MVSAEGLGPICGDLMDAVRERDDGRVHDALQRMAAATRGASPREVDEALAQLLTVLATIRFGKGADLAKLAGAMTDFGTGATVVLPVLVERAAEAMEQAARFARAYGDAFGGLPDAGDPELIAPTITRAADTAPQWGMTQREGIGLVEAWFTGGDWVQPVLYLAQRKDMRVVLPQRERLTAAIDAVREHIGTAHWLYGLLRVLDDAPLVVLHRPDGRGYRVIISGIGDNFQLHTLLAARLIGGQSQGLLAGTPPSPAEIAAASDGADLTPPGGLTGCFNLVDAYGKWIWNEGRPSDIPRLESEHVVVLDPWRAICDRSVRAEMPAPG